MIILRIGSTTVSYSRYIDLLMNPEIELLIFLADKRDSFIKNLTKFFSSSKFSEIYKKKVRIYEFELSNIKRVIRGILYRSSRFSIEGEFIRLFTRELAPALEFMMSLYFRRSQIDTLKNVINTYSPDFIWSGSNDFDGSNFITWYVKESHGENIPLIRSYKEHRCRFVLDEKKALELSDALVLPSLRNTEILERIYSLDLKSKTLIADEDWRSSYVIDYVRSISVSKLSSIDGHPHVVILTGVATYGTHDYRRGSRYNYLKIIRELVKSRVYVHLHTKNIIERTGSSKISLSNPYTKLAEESEFFKIEKPLDLEYNLEDYLILKRYDAGILHNYVEGEPISLFTKINIPNRLYEYQIADVLPIVISNTMLDVEDIIKDTGFGIIASDYSEVSEKLMEIVRRNRKPIIFEGELPTFGKFVDILLNAYNITKKFKGNKYSGRL